LTLQEVAADLGNPGIDWPASLTTPPPTKDTEVALQ